jgi:hypothetical protein
MVWRSVLALGIGGVDAVSLGRPHDNHVQAATLARSPMIVRSILLARAVEQGAPIRGVDK